MRIMRRGSGLSALIAASLMLSNGALRADDQPVVHLKAVVKNGAVRLQAAANAPLEYTTYRPSESLYVVELSGVSTTDPAGARVVASDLVKSYRLVPYSVGNRPMVRVEILMSKGVDPEVQRNDSQDIDMVLSRSAHADSVAIPSEGKPAVRQASEVTEDSKPAARFGSIEQVNLAQNGGQTQVSVVGSTQLNYHATRLLNPDRLVLDFSGSHLRTTTKHIPSNLEPIREIRLAQFTPDTSRVVIDLRSAAGYNVTAEGNTVVVSFGSIEPAAGAAKSLPLASPADLISISTKAKSTQAASDSTGTAVPVQIATPVAVLPASLTDSSTGFASPLPSQTGQQAVAATRLASEASATAGAASAASAMNDPAPVQAAGGAQMQASGGSARYSGEPISVNLKNVDLLDFFRLIHEISGLNVVVDPNVRGNFTIVLDNVPWDQALDIALKDNELDKQLDGNVLRIATKATLRKEAEDNRDLAKAQMEAADVVTTTRVLNYAKATILMPTLKKFLSSRGDVIADDRSNTLIIRDVPGTLPVIDNLLRQLDRKAQQVEIEARIVSATRNFSRDIGTQFGIATANASRSNIFGGTGAVGTSPITRVFGNPTATPPTFGLPVPPVIVSPSANPATGSIPLMSNLPSTAPTSGISYAFSSTNFALDMIITAAESKGVGKLISQTKLFTQNNQKDYVKQGTKIPVQTVVNNTVSVQFVDAVLELDVTPQITADGNVYMDVTIENDQPNNNVEVQGIPEIITQAVESKVTVDDGATVVIGGIIVNNSQTNIDQVPLFGSLPVIGNLFKHTTVTSTSQELLFFLTPRIIPG
jgi:type IV pilus secretin PilQ/predicted competence protein